MSEHDNEPQPVCDIIELPNLSPGKQPSGESCAGASDSSEKQPKWYVVATKPHQESVAEVSLQKFGIETFVPFMQERKVIRRKEQDKVSVLFPGYIFAKFDADDAYRVVVYARGVKTIVRFGQMLAGVEESLIAGIRNRMEDGLVVVRHKAFEAGQVVRIQDGPLHGLEAIFEREMTSSQRAILLLKALSYQARVIVELDNVVNL